MGSPGSPPASAFVREERAGDAGGIRAVNTAAFETPAEARLVDLLRDRGQLLVSLVAEEAGRIVGHIAFSPVRLAQSTDRRGAGLGPMAVAPERQRAGIGSRLVHEGLDRCRTRGLDFAVVLGHPDYYPRFGFVAAGAFGIRCRWEAPEGVFMALELRPGGLSGACGLVTYRPEFDDV